ncbi:MAG TPA: hypothetical protein VFZ38_10635 [Vicinamibacterales bacterium]
MNRILTVLLVVACLPGCAPVIVSSTPRMVVVGNSNAQNTAATNQLAEQECQKENRHAVLVPDNIRDGNATFECRE